MANIITKTITFIELSQDEEDALWPDYMARRPVFISGRQLLLWDTNDGQNTMCLAKERYDTSKPYYQQRNSIEFFDVIRPF